MISFQQIENEDQQTTSDERSHESKRNILTQFSVFVGTTPQRGKKQAK